MEIGSFLELDLRLEEEFFEGNKNIARLNSARAGIYHALRVMDKNMIYMPYYICPSVKSFLRRKGVIIEFYDIDEFLKPKNLKRLEDDAVILIVNYFGLFSSEKLSQIADFYKNVIIDNASAFFCPPIKNCLSIYSPRKFFGVPDGCYVVGNNAHLSLEIYDRDYSSETSLFLLKRHEVGSSRSYVDRMQNEKRIEESDVLKMSQLTSVLLKGIDYLKIKNTRRKNFLIARKYFDSLNCMDISKLWSKEATPMIYPLVLENEALVDNLIDEKIYTGRWWKDVLNHVEKDSIEAWLSKFMVPLPIDQRYSENEIRYCFEKIVELI